MLRVQKIVEMQSNQNDKQDGWQISTFLKIIDLKTRKHKIKTVTKQHSILTSKLSLSIPIGNRVTKLTRKFFKNIEKQKYLENKM